MRFVKGVTDQLEDTRRNFKRKKAYGGENGHTNS